MKTFAKEKVNNKENIVSEQLKSHNDGGTIIDWQNVWDRIEDEELIKDITVDFLLENTERMKLLGLAVNSMDLREILFYSHAIKGSASSIAARFVRSAFICRLMASTMSRGGSIFWISTRVTLTPHRSVASSRIRLNSKFIFSRDTSASSRLISPMMFLKFVCASLTAASSNMATL